MTPRAELGAFAAGAVLLVGGLIAWGAVGERRLDALAADNASLEREVEALRAIAGDLPGPDEQQAIEADLRARIEVARELVSRGDLVAHLPAAMATAKGDVGWWTSLSVRGDRLELEGEGLQPEDAAAALDGVRSVPCLKDVALQSVQRRKEGGASVQRYRIGATVLRVDPASGGPCDIEVPPPSEQEDPFLSAAMVERIRRRVSLPAIRRYPLRELRLVAVEAGDTASGGRVEIADPEGGRHRAIVGTVVGDGRARITQILPDMVLLSEDRVVDEETGAVRTRAFTMELQAD